MSSNARIAVVGCGLIGQSWAALFACHGYDVNAWDPSPAAFDGFADHIEKARGQVRSMRSAERAEGSVHVVRSLDEAVSEACWIQENAPESVELKTELYRRIERAAPVEAVVASSTSSLRWSELAPGFERPGRFITAHPFNPPHLMPLVEIYAAEAGVLRRAVDFYQRLEREVVVLRRDATGHIANRLQSALWREALNILQEDIADVEAIDRALVHGPGLRWSVVGACMASHLGGGPGGIHHYLKHLGPSQERRWASLGSPKLTAELCTKLADGVLLASGGRTVEQLEGERNDRLMRVIAARKP